MGTRGQPADRIAIIGMSGRFPGAATLDQYWQNLRDGVESITFFTADDLVGDGLDPSVLDDAAYVNASGVLEGIDLFDAAFFGCTPREADIMDPQHRLFLECAWEALEHSGYNPHRYPGSIGLYGGTAASTYLNGLRADPALMSLMGSFQVSIANDKDHLTTRVAYKFNLRGPSVTVQTTCSTSLVAVVLASHALEDGRCDMALAGGASIGVPQRAGYFHQEGGILSPDGHCRAFDAAARGTIGGNGVGLVVLKRLSDALRDSDCIHAIIRGAAINNDGAVKVGYTAPSVEGQARVIAMAQAAAGVDPDTITYVEAHGTGTPLGDPIEIAALTQTFRERTTRTGYCAIGSVKSNIGHLDCAAGVAGLIKTVLSLEHEEIPPSLHLDRPNPALELERSPFFVNSRLTAWVRGDAPRTAAVSSFGIGGTNAHVIVEEAPTPDASGPARPCQLLLLSARTPAALERAAANLTDHLTAHATLNLADVAYTLHTGRVPFAYRRAVVARDTTEAIRALTASDGTSSATPIEASEPPPVVFAFPGQGVQHAGMARELYDAEPAFRARVDDCCERFRSRLGDDLRDTLYPSAADAQAAAARLAQTVFAQPALFTVEYALARLWMDWGVTPHALIGHSIGELVAACLSGVFSIDDAITVVALRATLMQQLRGGAMMAVSLAEAHLLPWLDDSVAIAAINAPDVCVVSGETPSIDRLESRLRAGGHAVRRLPTSHAFHSPMMEPILESFAEGLRGIDLHAPEIPYISNVTGTWATLADVTEPTYWSRQLRQTVRYADGLRVLLDEPDVVLLECGPGRTLSVLSKRLAATARSAAPGAPATARDSTGRAPIVASSLPDKDGDPSSLETMLAAAGRLWTAGAELDAEAFYSNQRRRRVPLPTYPFERARHWIDAPPKTDARPERTSGSSLTKAPLSRWFYLPTWQRAVPPRPRVSGDGDDGEQWLIFVDACGVGASLAASLRAAGARVITVGASPGDLPDACVMSADDALVIDPDAAADYVELFDRLRITGPPPTRIVHCWGVTPRRDTNDTDDESSCGFFSIVHLGQALAKLPGAHPIELTVVTTNLYEVVGDETVRPGKALVLGPCRVIPQELPHVRCRTVDIALSSADGSADPTTIDHLLSEVRGTPGEVTVAYRGAHRWVQRFVPMPLEPKPAAATALRARGVYLVTGGLGNIGLALAEHLARACSARLVLVGRSVLPPRAEWPERLASHADGDSTSHVIRRLQRIEDAGGEVLVMSADVADREAMGRAVELARKMFGALNGVIHAAGTTDASSFRPLQETTREVCERHFGAKVEGLRVLRDLLRGEQLDFCLLCSSLSAVLGGLGFTAYAAANAYMDAFASEIARRREGRWLSVGWDGWQFRTGSLTGTTLESLALTPAEGVEAFDRLVAGCNSPHAVVSTGDLETRFDQWVRLTSIATGGVDVESPLPSAARPPRRDAYLAPTNEIEAAIAELWQQLLGVDRVGLHDDFFDLGGHSLLAVQLISRLRDRFQIELSVNRLFEGPTVAELATAVAARLDAEHVNLETFDQMLTLVEGLSDEQVRALLAKGNGAPDAG